MNVEEELKKGKEYFLSNHKEIVSLYRQEFGETISICGAKCVSDAFNRLKAKYDKRKYKMKRGRAIANNYRIVGGPDHFNYHNCTDEYAEKLIKLGYQSYFE